jgi:hypothetical protein
MRYSIGVAFGVALFGLALVPAPASASGLDQWFTQATGLRAKGTVQHITAPDFMCGTTFKTMCKEQYFDGAPNMLSFWSLLRYDRVHKVGLARCGTDQVGFALFKASPPPGVTVPSADLSRYGTGKGLRIGSSYAQVIALYGPPVKHDQHFVTSYGADDTIYFQGKPEIQPELITLVIDNGRVSSITVHIERWEP